MAGLTTWTFTIGGLVAVTGIVAYVATGAASLTALIPTALGVLLLVCAVIARSPKAHKHAIHAALIIALIGLAGTLMNVVKIGDLLAGTAERPAAIIASIITFVLLAVYLVLGIRSFIGARRARQAAA